MRHNVYGKKLGRNRNARTALFKNLVQSLFISGSIETTEAKAKAIKGLVDRLITQAKSPTTKRLVSQFLVSKVTQERLFKEIVPQVKSRNSGYTSVIKLGRRMGDGAMIVKMSLLTEQPLKPMDIKVTSDKQSLRANALKRQVTSKETKKSDEPQESKVAKEKVEDKAKTVKPTRTRKAVKK